MSLFPSRVLGGEDSQAQQAMGFTKSEEAHVCSLSQAGIFGNWYLLPATSSQEDWAVLSDLGV